MEGLSALIEVIVQPCHVGDGTSPEALAPVHGILDYDGKQDEVLHKMVKNGVRFLCHRTIDLPRR